ncbi:hypothetical protein CEXT_547251 [Caerostris extrusa]|uniref:Maturase K n=1 Tax=Caerostris extrusa TaxID=172846 RepID=A0AAV4VIG1_CAEEX|nr:hypothetical protein CEXT_547251 [Caerostris extrusa]
MLLDEEDYMSKNNLEDSIFCYTNNPPYSALFRSRIFQTLLLHKSQKLWHVTYWTHIHSKGHSHDWLTSSDPVFNKLWKLIWNRLELSFLVTTAIHRQVKQSKRCCHLGSRNIPLALVQWAARSDPQNISIENFGIKSAKCRVPPNLWTG